jgi:hypothetical protein
MLISTSSTSTKPEYEAHLDELLAVIHRDGGQYTVLAGREASIIDATAKVKAMRLEMKRLFSASKRKNV